MPLSLLQSQFGNGKRERGNLGILHNELPDRVSDSTLLGHWAAINLSKSFPPLAAVCTIGI
jgi:hypothetical protein